MILSWPEVPPVGELTCLAHNTPRPVLRPFLTAKARVTEILPPSLQKSVRSGRELARARRQQVDEVFPTAVDALDQLLRGGLARGHLVELVGRKTSGRFSTTLGVLAAVTSAGEAAALVDLGDGLDPRSAAGAGIDLERLLWLRPRHLKEAFRGTEMLIASGFPMIVLDLGQPPVAGGRGGEAFWLRLARSARDRGAALLISSPYRVSGTAASAVLQAQTVRPTWQGYGASPRLLTGLRGRLFLDKARGRRPGEHEALGFRCPQVPTPNRTQTDREQADRKSQGVAPPLCAPAMAG